MLNARRTQGLRDLSVDIVDARTLAEIGRGIDAQHPNLALDLPFLLIYRIDADAEQLARAREIARRGQAQSAL